MNEREETDDLPEIIWDGRDVSNNAETILVGKYNVKRLPKFKLSKQILHWFAKAKQWDKWSQSIGHFVWV